MFIYYITKCIVAMKYCRNNYVFPYSMLENGVALIETRKS